MSSNAAPPKLAFNRHPGASFGGQQATQTPPSRFANIPIEDNPFEDSFLPLKTPTAGPESYPFPTPPITLPSSSSSSSSPPSSSSSAAPYPSTSLPTTATAPSSDTSSSAPKASQLPSLPSLPSSTTSSVPSLPSNLSLASSSSPSPSPVKDLKKEAEEAGDTTPVAMAEGGGEGGDSDPHHGLILLAEAENHSTTKPDKAALQKRKPSGVEAMSSSLYLDEGKDGGPKRLRRATKDMTPEEKRKIYLERNKVAASKCRQRKKQWLDETQSRARQLTSDNQSLQEELQKLQEEQGKLLSYLEQHRGCAEVDEFLGTRMAIEQRIREQLLSQEVIASPVPAYNHSDSDPNTDDEPEYPQS